MRNNGEFRRKSLALKTWKQLKAGSMPVIGKIKGIILRMFYSDHPPPHFHATNNEKNGLFKIEDAKMFKGDLSERIRRK